MPADAASRLREASIREAAAQLALKHALQDAHTAIRQMNEELGGGDGAA